MIVFDGSAVKSFMLCLCVSLQVPKDPQRLVNAGEMVREFTYHSSVRCLGGTRPTEFGRNGPCPELKTCRYLVASGGSQKDTALRQR